jgi:hypothetical protein
VNDCDRRRGPKNVVSCSVFVVVLGATTPNKMQSENAQQNAKETECKNAKRNAKEAECENAQRNAK